MSMLAGAGTTHVGTLRARLLAERQRSATWLWNERMANYARWDSYYENTIYDQTSAGGWRDELNQELGGAACADLDGLYNPVRTAVNLYLHVFGGAFGDEITIEPEGKATQALVDAIGLVWKASNMTIARQSLCRIAARSGLAGIRIVADPDRRHVYLKIEHPRIIRDVQLDQRGNVTAIQLEYDITIGLAEAATVITIREEMTKAAFKTWRVDSPTLGGDSPSLVPYDMTTMTDNGPRAVIINTLGVVPYVLCYHEQSQDDDWGLNCFSHATRAIDRLNAQISHVDIQIHRTVKSKWLVAAAGQPPQEFDMSDMTIVYIDTSGQPGTPEVQPMIAPLDLSGALAQSQHQLALIEDRLPELKATQGRFLAGQSGETIAELRKPAEEAILLARGNYEDSMIRAQQIAVSWGILLGFWNVGTGSGTREAADRAYRDGFEDHKFNKRPAMTTEPVETTRPDSTQSAPEVAGNMGSPDQTPEETRSSPESGKLPVSGIATPN